MTKAEAAMRTALDVNGGFGVTGADTSAVLAALSAAGWLVVPKVATEAMEKAAGDAWDLWWNDSKRYPGGVSGAMYCAMLAAALAEVGGGDGT